MRFNFGFYEGRAYKTVTDTHITQSKIDLLPYEEKSITNVYLPRV